MNSGPSITLKVSIETRMRPMVPELSASGSAKMTRSAANEEIRPTEKETSPSIWMVPPIDASIAEIRIARCRASSVAM